MKKIKNKKLRIFMKINFYLIVITGIIIMAANHGCSSATYVEGDTQLTKIEKSENFREGKFRNYVPWDEPGVLSWMKTGLDWIFSKEERVPKIELPLEPVDLSKFNRQSDNILNVTWLGHSSLMINIDGFKILVDPVLETKVSFFGPTHYNGDVPLNIHELPDINLVLITHNHYDHLNKFSIQLIKDKTDKFITPLAVGAELEGWGVSRDKITELDWWEEISVFDSLIISLTPTQHFSGRSMTDRNETLWGSYVVTAPNHKIYLCGDSGYSDSFKKIGEKYGPFDMTFLECGAYNEKWHHIHMFPEETVQAHLDLKGKVLQPIHWGTFNLSLHAWDEPMERFIKAAELKDINYAIPVVGSTTEYPDNLPKSKWWQTKKRTNK